VKNASVPRVNVSFLLGSDFLVLVGMTGRGPSASFGRKAFIINLRLVAENVRNTNGFG
jgi:hypothetical protein